MALTAIPSSYRRELFNCLNGNKLRILTLEKCPVINPLELLIFSELETLVIRRGPRSEEDEPPITAFSNIEPTNYPTAAAAFQLLPKLKRFSSEMVCHYRIMSLEFGLSFLYYFFFSNSISDSVFLL